MVITILEKYNVSRNITGELYSSTKQHKNLYQMLVNSTNCQYCQLALPVQIHQISTNPFTSHKSHMLNSMCIRVVLNDNGMKDKRNFNTSKDV